MHGIIKSSTMNVGRQNKFEELDMFVTSGDEITTASLLVFCFALHKDKLSGTVI
jgi:hypothetical protein